ncbi:MAG TPA: hypothetical protein VGL98_11545 [Gammaproteobacteria bacterium]
MSMTAHLEELGRRHGFTLDELEANRRGGLHPKQRARGLHKGRVAVIVLTTLAILAAACGLVGGYLFYDGLGAEPSRVDVNAAYAIGGVGVLIGLVFFICAAVSAVRKRARKAAFAAGRIDVLEGPMNKIHIRGRGTASQLLFRVGGRSFPTSSRKLWDLLTQGANYRLYCVADQLLSFEPVAAQDGRKAPSPGDIRGNSDDPGERAEYERELAHFERTRNTKPSKLVR